MPVCSEARDKEKYFRKESVWRGVREIISTSMNRVTDNFVGKWPFGYAKRFYQPERAESCIYDCGLNSLDMGWRVGLVIHRNQKRETWTQLRVGPEPLPDTFIFPADFLHPVAHNCNHMLSTSLTETFFSLDSHGSVTSQWSSWKSGSCLWFASLGYHGKHWLLSSSCTICLPIYNRALSFGPGTTSLIWTFRFCSQ